MKETVIPISRIDKKGFPAYLLHDEEEVVSPTWTPVKSERCGPVESYKRKKKKRGRTQ